MAIVECTDMFRCRITLFTVHGVADTWLELAFDVRVHPDGEPYSDDIVKQVIALRDSRSHRLGGKDWTTGAILLEVWSTGIFLPSRLIPPRKGKLSIFD